MVRKSFYRSPCRSLFAWGKGRGKIVCIWPVCFTWNLIPCDVFETISEHLGVAPAWNFRTLCQRIFDRCLPCICGTGKILGYLQWVWGFDAERRTLFTLVHWSNSLFSRWNFTLYLKGKILLFSLADYPDFSPFVRLLIYLYKVVWFDRPWDCILIVLQNQIIIYSASLQVMTCGSWCGFCRLSKPRPAGDEWDL